MDFLSKPFQNPKAKPQNLREHQKIQPELRNLGDPAIDQQLDYSLGQSSMEFFEKLQKWPNQSNSPLQVESSGHDSQTEAQHDSQICIESDDTCGLNPQKTVECFSKFNQEQDESQPPCSSPSPQIHPIEAQISNAQNKSSACKNLLSHIFRYLAKHSSDQCQKERVLLTDIVKYQANSIAKDLANADEKKQQVIKLTPKMILLYWIKKRHFNLRNLNYLREDLFYRKKLEELSKKETFEPLLDGKKMKQDNKTCFKNCDSALFGGQNIFGSFASGSEQQNFEDYKRIIQLAWKAFTLRIHNVTNQAQHSDEYCIKLIQPILFCDTRKDMLEENKERLSHFIQMWKNILEEDRKINTQALLQSLRRDRKILEEIRHQLQKIDTSQLFTEKDYKQRINDSQFLFSYILAAWKVAKHKLAPELMNSLSQEIIQHQTVQGFFMRIQHMIRIFGQIYFERCKSNGGKISQLEEMKPIYQNVPTQNVQNQYFYIDKKVQTSFKKRWYKKEAMKIEKIEKKIQRRMDEEKDNESIIDKFWDFGYSKKAQSSASENTEALSSDKKKTKRIRKQKKKDQKLSVGEQKISSIASI